MNADLRKRVRFFQENAGYCTPPGKMACALALARAEVWREEQEAEGLLTVEWEYDALPYEMGDLETKMPDEVLCCIVTLGDETASLCGIGDPSPEYRRVVEAELSQEIQTDMFTAIRAHLDNLR